MALCLDASVDQKKHGWVAAWCAWHRSSSTSLPPRCAAVVWASRAGFDGLCRSSYRADFASKGCVSEIKKVARFVSYGE
jgi:hypothetical protein